MPQPTLSDVHVNRPLTNISVAFMQEAAGVEFVAGKVFPEIPVENKTDNYWTYNRGDFNRDTMKKRGLSQESAGDGYKVDPTASYSCDVWALHKDVDDQIRANTDNPLSPDRDATIFLSQKALIRRENIWVTSYFSPGIWTGNAAGASSSDASFSNAVNLQHWDTAGSTPIQDVRKAKTQMRLNSGGFTPNVLVFSRPVFDILLDHPDFIDRVKYGQTAGPGMMNPAMANRVIIAQILEVEDVYVIDAVYNTANEGLAEANAFIGGLDAALYYRPKQAGLMTPSAGYIFNWTGLIGSVGGAGVRMKSFREERLASDRIEIDAAFAMKMVSADCGFFFNDIITGI